MYTLTLIIKLHTYMFIISFLYFRHIKASSPTFNVVIIIGSLLMYPAALFTALSYSGTLIENEDIRQKAIPAFCEVLYFRCML